MEEVLVFQHDPFEDLGVFAEILEKQRARYRVIQLFNGEMPAENWERVRALIVLGGPMSADDEDRFPFLRWEKRIIRAAIDEAVPILGVCLGAQLIANALGTVTYHGRLKEIGWSPIFLTPHGQVDSLLGYLPETATVFQWHDDSFELPSGAVRLASSAHYENQAFRLGKSVYGLQFHLEVTPRTVERWVEQRSKDLAAAPYVLREKILADTPSYAPALKYYADRFLSEFIRRMSRRGPQRGDGGQAVA
ncbi:MAG TPA: gamma-glutamyl-gamma-aminobutyrate hydrolase family protein [candidate division Zixibacteria bacterium]|nr:gamma-glutamyl-gamma-aminobutyrate hydrolase family protein [candidate division Zixibacteria bacterium]